MENKSGERNVFTELTFPPSVAGESHKFHFGFTLQSLKKPKFVRFSFLKLAPIERSGTITIAFLIFWFWSLSKAININALLFPEAGGDLISKYCSPLFAYARSCIGRIPN